MKIIVSFVIYLTTITSLNAQIWDFDGVRVLGGEINSIAEESSPIFSKDSSILYFVRMYDSQNRGGLEDQDIWVSYRTENGDYSDCKQLSSINTKYNNGVIGVSTDGSTLYLLNTYEGKKDLEKGIASSTRKGTSGWNDPEKIEVPTLDIEGDYYGFHISEDQKVMFISYAGPGTIGAEDLYFSLKSDAGWSPPVNLGTDINTTGFEMSPFLSKGQDTLFFSSNGHGGVGDADIFYAVKQGSWTSWSTPKNLGSKINSEKFDAFFSYSGNNVYWSSNREGERSDIYTAYFIFPPPLVLSCMATNATFYQGANGRVDLTIEGGVPPFNFAWSNGSTDEDLAGVLKGEYSVVVTDAVGQQATSSCSVDEPAPVVFDPVDIATFKNIEFMHYFDYNKNKLTVSKGDLKDFVKEIEKQLKDGRERITINIYSSASNVPTKTYESNDKLTQIRAENMKYDLQTYFDEKNELKGKVNVAIVSAIVDGPEYDQDARDMKKYRPYQFVGLKTE